MGVESTRLLAAVAGAMLLAGGATAQKMATTGAFDVSSSGAATYVVPLQLPPNTGGHAATLALSYRSEDGNGLFGVGWSLSGVSAITRCAKNLTEEGVRQGVQNDWSDVYCLDGQKLRLKSGSYGGNGATYATARETYSRVTSYGAAGSGPQWFKVELKDGRILEFGRTADSRLEVSSGLTVRAWMLNAAMDRSANGNPIRYSYERDLAIGEHVLSTVQYTNGYVAFEYEARPADDPIVRFDAGAQHGSTSRRVKTIRMYSEPLVDGSPVRRLYKVYRVAYSQSGATRRTLLRGVQECNGDGEAAVCLPALSFDYSNTSSSDVALVARGAPGYSPDALPPIDIDGSGTLEIGSAHTLIKNMPGNRKFALAGIWDYNSDGRMDVEGKFVSINAEPTTASVLLSDGSLLGGGGSIELGDLPYACRADLDGDGATDALRAESSILPNRDIRTIKLDSWANGALTSRPISHNLHDWSFYQLTRSSCIATDFNGDGAAEALIPWAEGEPGMTVFTFQPGTTSNELRVSVFAELEKFEPEAVMLHGDYNGDGKTDVISIGPFQSAQLWTSSGRSMVQTTLNGVTLKANAYDNKNIVCAGDFNGDGRTDLYLFATREFLLSTSVDFVSMPSGIPAGAHGLEEIVHCTDINGDGRADIYLPNTAQIWSAAVPGPMDYLSEVRSGVGQGVRVSYKPLTDTTVYSKGLGSTYPMIDLQPAKYVVSRAQASDGKGGFVPSAYTYEGLRAHLRRNGTVGFAKVTVLNEVSGVSVETTYRQDYPYAGLPATVRKFRGGQTLENTQLGYQAFDQTAQFARVHPVSVESQKFDLDGSFMSRTRELLTDIDAYGNSRSQSIEHLDESGSTVVSRRSLTQTFLNDPGRWLIGLSTGTTTASQVSRASIPAALGTPDPTGPQVPPVPPPALSPGALAAILQLLLDD